MTVHQRNFSCAFSGKSLWRCSITEAVPKWQVDYRLSRIPLKWFKLVVAPTSFQSLSCFIWNEMESSVDSSPAVANSAITFCISHHRQLIVFCEECGLALCDSCLSSATHHNHTFSTLPDECKKQMASIIFLVLLRNKMEMADSRK